MANKRHPVEMQILARVVRGTLSFLFSLLLCQCATQHQPLRFEPYFLTVPAGFHKNEYIQDKIRLETEPNRSLIDNKRLADLYRWELRVLPPQSPKALEIKTKLAQVEPSITEIESRIQDVQKEIKENKELPLANKKGSENSEGFLKIYKALAKLWNDDQITEALKLFATSPVSSSWSSQEKTRYYYLRFRVALDAGDLILAESSYQAIREEESCSEQAARSGFTLSLVFLYNGKNKKALDVWRNQCDPDTSLATVLKRKYWEHRFAEAAGEKPDLSHEDKAIPSFYTAFTKFRLSQAIRSDDFLKSDLKELTVDGRVHDLFTQAEFWIKSSHRLTAEVFLRRASQILIVDGKVEAGDFSTLVYLAHLYQSIGNQLEAMKIYALVIDTAQKEDLSVKGIFDLKEVFPKPFSIWVDANCKMWNIDKDFLYALMRQESAFNPGALSPVKARGLVQIMPTLAESISKYWGYPFWFSKRLLFFPKENIQMSAYHVKQLEQVFPHPALVAAAYNAGAQRVQKWWMRYPGAPLDVFIELIPIQETQSYVKLVLRNYIFYRLQSKESVKADVFALTLPKINPDSLNTFRGQFQAVQ